MDKDTIIKTIDNQLFECKKEFEASVIRQEQIRGQYTGLVNLRAKLLEETMENKDTSRAPKEEEKLASVEVPKKEDKVISPLSEEEMAKLKEQMAKQNIAKPVEVPKKEDIPDYLQPEYNK